MTERQIYGLNLSTTALRPTVSLMAGAGLGLGTGQLRSLHFYCLNKSHHIWPLQGEDHHNYLDFPRDNGDSEPSLQYSDNVNLIVWTLPAKILFQGQPGQWVLLLLN